MENLIIEILMATQSEVLKRDIPSPTIPEYIEHHRDCMEICEYISMQIEKYKGKSNKDIAEMLVKGKE